MQPISKIHILHTWGQKDGNCNITHSNVFALCRILCYLNQDWDTLRAELTTLSTKLVMSEESILNPSSSQLVSPTKNDSEELSIQHYKYNVLLARIEKLDHFLFIISSIIMTQ